MATINKVVINRRRKFQF